MKNRSCVFEWYVRVGSLRGFRCNFRKYRNESPYHDSVHVSVDIVRYMSTSRERNMFPLMDKSGEWIYAV